MTQRIFDIENEKDMQDLWDIVPENIVAIEKSIQNSAIYRTDLGIRSGYQYIKINWHDKTEITRPIQEATEQDIGKICAFWNKDNDEVSYGKLLKIDERFNPHKYQASGEWGFIHCRRLIKQEIKELC
jgi:hypothetical protein